MTPQQCVQDLIGFIDSSPSPWHVGASIKTWLEKCGFVGLDETQTWSLAPGGKYFVLRDGSSVIAFIAGQKPLYQGGFKIIGAHTDSPGLRIKPNAPNVAEGWRRLGVEIYGGPILATFSDRDLSIAGRVSFRQDGGKVEVRLVNIARPILRLPNLAIHMNRTVNEDGLKFHKQSELPLILNAVVKDQFAKPYFIDLLTQAADIENTEILAWELNVYDTQQGAFWGPEQEFYTDSQLDNLASCHASLSALTDASVSRPENTLVVACFDHEEIGSCSQKGADGSFLSNILERIALATKISPEEFRRSLAQSFLISADMAHAYQPNFPGVYEADHKVMVNQGPVIKMNANQRYASESLSAAMFSRWCEIAKVPYQTYTHRTDLACGSTIGPMAAANLGIRTVDVGCPMWAMHSIRESAGVNDHADMIKVFQTFFLDSEE